MDMKKPFYILALLAAILGMAGCRSANSYSNLLKAEKNLIKAYIARNELQIVDTMPSDEAFASNPKLYYRCTDYDNLYYRLEKRGTVTEDSLAASQRIAMRYIQYTLEEHADTASFWTTLDSSNPVVFLYLTDLYNAKPASCAAWHVAARYMQYDQSECQIICPSKAGFTEAASAVIPYGFRLKLRVHP